MTLWLTRRLTWRLRERHIAFYHIYTHNIWSYSMPPKCQLTMSWTLAAWSFNAVAIVKTTQSCRGYMTWENMGKQRSVRFLVSTIFTSIKKLNYFFTSFYFIAFLYSTSSCLSKWKLLTVLRCDIVQYKSKPLNSTSRRIGATSLPQICLNEIIIRHLSNYVKNQLATLDRKLFHCYEIFVRSDY